MTNASYQQLAKEFMDLWQKQVASVVSDKQFIQAMLEMIETMRMPNANPASPSHPANSSGTHDGLHAELAFRLSQCERRIAALEKAAKEQAKPKKAARKAPRRSKTTK